MMYKYLSVLSLPLAISINLLNTTSASSLEVLTNKNSAKNTLITTQIISQASRDRSEETGYLSLMNAGYSANEKQDYLTALNYFQQALNLHPKDSKAQTAIKTVSSYGFDLYMRSGYTADKIKDYNTALQNFQKALQIRPDSLYAKQAIDNVTYYLAQQPIEDNANNGDNEVNLLWMFIVIGIASVLSGVLLFYLFKKTGSSLQSELDNSSNNELNDAESTLPKEISERLQPLSEASPSTTNSPDREIEANTESESEPIATPQSDLPKPKPSTTTSNENTSIVSSNNSLPKLDIVPELIRDLEKSDRTLRSKTIWELAQRGDSRAMKPLVELMVDVDSQERGLILEAMTQIAGRTLKPMNKAIMMSLEDENANVKQNAIRDLTRVYELMSQVTKRLALVVEDSDAQVQETAKWALQKLNQMPNYSTSKVDDLTNEMNSINTNNGTNGIDKNRKPDYPLN